eukprot:TRINITY_DN7880_c0_g2_i1.p1 TRINITY_DN7880_c0_g2~~TRINITY_DN7880_c0_g2_i1.p1  ORF type:complete len:103 (+),score=0.69 TRINITY_DN7880_c0_g2_i1:189-497(+)
MVGGGGCYEFYYRYSLFSSLRHFFICEKKNKFWFVVYFMPPFFFFLRSKRERERERRGGPIEKLVESIDDSDCRRKKEKAVISKYGTRREKNGGKGSIFLVH